MKIVVTKGPSPSANPLTASISVASASGAPITAQQAVVGMTVVATVTLSVSNPATGPVTGVRADAAGVTNARHGAQPTGGPSPPVPGDGLHHCTRPEQGL